MAKKLNEGVAKAPKKTSIPAPKTDALPEDGAAVVAKTTKARATSVPPKTSRPSSKGPAVGLTTSGVNDIPAPMTNGVAIEISEQQIREHAYHLWLNGTPGDAAHHWHTAEQALRSRKG